MTPEPTLPDANSSLQSWLAWLEHLHPVEIELGLTRVSEVAEKALLTEQLPIIVTVGGTNGKGSVVAMLTAIFGASGYTVGAYTSPHLVRFNERMKLNGEEVEDAVITAALHSIETARGDVSLTYFEYTTLAAMQIFKSRGVDIALMEVGLGGRLDAVNLWDTDCAIITSIALDHESYLGSTRDAVATEKVAIARRNKPLVIAEHDRPAALDTLAKASGATLYRVNEEYRYHLNDAANGLFSLSTGIGEGQYPVPSLAGEHQVSNASAAIVAVEALAHSSGQTMKTVSAEQIAQGLRQAYVAGRFEHQRFRGVDVYRDVAHNPAAATALASALSDIRSLSDASVAAGACSSRRQVHAVVAMMSDKDISAVIDILAPDIDSWYCGTLDMPRALAADDLARMVLDRGQQEHPTEQRHPREVSVHDSVWSAFESAIQAATEAGDGALVLVFGSFFTVGEVMSQWTDT